MVWDWYENLLILSSTKRSMLAVARQLYRSGPAAILMPITQQLVQHAVHCRLLAMVHQLPDMQPAAHASFRLILTTATSAELPIALRQLPCSLVLQAPTGVRGTLHNIIETVTEPGLSLGNSGAQAAWPELMLRLCLVHAVALVRTASLNSIAWHMRTDMTCRSCCSLTSLAKFQPQPC